MLQLIKQVLKSFKSSILLLIGLFFISFAIVFATFSSLYFSSNISNSYSSLQSKSNGNQVILEKKDSNLNNKTLSFDYDLDLNNDVRTPLTSSNSTTTSTTYFSSLEDYANVNTSFIYQPTNLYHSSFVKQSGHKNYIFAYYVSSDKTSTNPYFTGTGINDASQMYKARARGILASYGNLEIPNQSNKWRAFGIELGNSDLKYIVYDIDPLTGFTNVSSNSKSVNTLGYFNKGYLNSTFEVNSGNLKYPSNVTAASVDNVSSTASYQYSNNGNATPFFVGSSDNTWWTTQPYDFSGSTLNEIISNFKKVEGTTDNPDISNIMSSNYVNSSLYLSLDKDIDWNIASLTPFYDYMRILRDKKYLTNTSTNNSKDFVFSIHLNMNNLSTLQKETLEYVKKTYGLQTYIDLTSFVYTVNSDWLKESLLSNFTSGSSTYNAVNAANFNTISSLNTSYDGNTALNVIKTWLQNYGGDKLKIVESNLISYEKEYLSNKLSELDDMTYKTQKSFTISDFKTSSSFIVSQKGGNYGETNENGDINQVVLSSGSNIGNGYKFLSSKYSYLSVGDNPTSSQKNNSTKYEDISNALLYAEGNKGSIAPIDEQNGYSINESGKYLMNLVKFINDSYLSGVSTTKATTSSSEGLSDRIKNLAASLVKDYDSNGSINSNDYYHLFALATPLNYFKYVSTSTSDNNSSYIFNNSSQNITYNMCVNGGFSSTTYNASVILVEPYCNAAIVNDQWLAENSKSVLPVSQWNSALLMTSSEFQNWKENLDSKYIISINSINFIIIGTGASFENSYPIVSIESPIPNPKTEGVIYVDDVGYNSLLHTNSSATQDNYFAIKFNNKSVDLDKINSQMSSYMDNAYLSSTLKSTTNLLTARISYPNMIKIYVNLFAIILVIVLFIVGIYLSLLLVKIYVEKNRIPLAVAKANGISTWQIALSLSVFGIIAAIISGVLGYLLAFVAQSMFVRVLSNFWFIPISLHNFSFIGVIGGISGLYLAFLLFSLLGVWKTFRSPINELLSSTEEIKVNRLLYLLKSRKVNIFALTKFRISLSLSKLTRFILFIVLCSAGLSIISLGSAVPEKFKTSQNYTLANKQYKYRYDLQTPSEQSGLYKTQNYAYLGVTDEANGIYDIYSNSMFKETNPYRKLVNDSEKKNLLALRDLNGNIISYNGKTLYYTNFLLPSYVAINQFNSDVEFFRNAIISKWLVDFEINIAGIYINAWDYVSKSFPDELISKVNAISNNFVSNILDVSELKTINDTKNYIIQDSSGDYILNSNAVLDLSSITDTATIRFNDEFLKFIGMVYGDKELSQLDAKISFGTVPFRDTTSTETYTYLDGTLNDSSIKIPSLRNNGKKRLTNISQKILGIKKDSTFVTLVDTKGNDLNSLLFETFDADSDGIPIYPVVINQGVAYKYNLSDGDEFKVDVSNTYDRYTNKIMGKNTAATIKLKVVGVSSDSFGTSMFISQENANSILGLNFSQGAAIIGTSTLNSNNIMTTTLLGDSSVLAANESSNTNDNNYQISIKNYPSDYVPFNGVFSNEDSPLLTNSLLLENISGIWANYSSFSDNNFNDLISYVGIKRILNLVLPYNSSDLTALCNYYGLSTTSRTSLINKIASNMTNSDLKSWLTNKFGTPSLVAITSFEYFSTTFDTYNTIFYTLLTIGTLLICLFVPLIIIIIMIVSSVMMNDFRKMIAILKTLGYSDRENLFSILIVFVPVMIISLIIGIAVVASLTTLFNFMIFNVTSIYLSPSISWLSYLYGLIAIIGIVVINFIFVTLYLKKQNLRNSII